MAPRARNKYDYSVFTEIIVRSMLVIQMSPYDSKCTILQRYSRISRRLNPLNQICFSISSEIADRRWNIDAVPCSGLSGLKFAPCRHAAQDTWTSLQLPASSWKILPLLLKGTTTQCFLRCKKCSDLCRIFVLLGSLSPFPSISTNNQSNVWITWLNA